MFLTGFAGAGKSTSVTVAQRFCYEFYRKVSIRWTDRTFLFTSTTGVSAALFGGGTIHGAAYLNCKTIDADKKSAWNEVRLLIVDEISFFAYSSLKKLDLHLKKITGDFSRPYGGISIVFCGDFHQLEPVAVEKSDYLYMGSNSGLWEGCINVAIFLEETHRFSKDPRYGEVLKRLWRGQMTREDIIWINTRVVGEKVHLPKLMEGDIAYACPTNKERNAISAGMFKEHIERTHPLVTSDDSPPGHTLIIEADIRSGKKASGGRTKMNRYLRDRIHASCGDDNCKVQKSHSDPDKSNRGGGAKIDPSLRLYVGAPAMCISNKNIDKGQANGTQCTIVGVKLKNTAPSLRWVNWDGRKVNAVSASDVDYVECMHQKDRSIIELESNIEMLQTQLNTRPDDEDEKTIARMKSKLRQKIEAKKFKLKPESFTVTVNVTVDEVVDIVQKVNNVQFTQIPLNMNDATTAHKLQGSSKDKLIATSWTKKFANYVYVVLSRVRTLSGLYLLQPLDVDDEEVGRVPRELLQHERKLRQLEQSVLEERRKRMNELKQQRIELPEELF